MDTHANLTRDGGSPPGLPFAAAVHPTQFSDLWNGVSVHGRAELALAAAVLEGAAEDVVKYRNARRRSHQRMYWEAYEWMESSDRHWPFSFLNICDCLRLSPAALRARLLGSVPSAQSEAA